MIKIIYETTNEGTTMRTTFNDNLIVTNPHTIPIAAFLELASLINLFENVDIWKHELHITKERS